MLTEPPAQPKPPKVNFSPKPRNWHPRAKSDTMITRSTTTLRAERTLAKAVPGCLRNRPPLLLTRTPLSRKATWLGPPSDPSPKVEETPRNDHTFRSAKESDCEFDANHTWNPRDRVLIREMEEYLRRCSEILVDVEELEAYLLCPKDVTGTIKAKMMRKTYLCFLIQKIRPAKNYDSYRFAFFSYSLSLSLYLSSHPNLSSHPYLMSLSLSLITGLSGLSLVSALARSLSLCLSLFTVLSLSLVTSLSFFPFLLSTLPSSSK